MKKLLFIILAAILSISSVEAQKKQTNLNWQKIGGSTLDFKTEKNAITMQGTDSYKLVRIVTTDEPVHVDNLIVVYESGDPETIPIRFDFKANTESRAINLNSNNRKIKEIDVVYRAIPNWKGDNTAIEIWGSK